MSVGRVTLVGAGPGDPGLLTVRGREALESADLVLYDRLGTAELLRLCRDDAELVSAAKGSSRLSSPRNAGCCGAGIMPRAAVS